MTTTLNIEPERLRDLLVTAVYYLRKHHREVPDLTKGMQKEIVQTFGSFEEFIEDIDKGDV
jgi:superoxide dismutase